MYHVITGFKHAKHHTSKISSRETSMRQCPVCGWSACNSWRSIFIFCTRSRLYFGNGESLSTTHGSSALWWFWHTGGASVDDGSVMAWLEKDGGGGCPIMTPAVVTTAAWLESRLQSHHQAKLLGRCAPQKRYFKTFIYLLSCLQCFDAVGWAAGRASGL